MRYRQITLKMFINRKEYLKEIKHYLNKPDSVLGVVRGRRRIGKSYFCNYLSNLDNFIYLNFSAAKTSKSKQILNFKNKLFNSINDLSLNFDFKENIARISTKTDWFSLMNELGILLYQANQFNLENKKIILIFDEFQWFSSARSDFLEAFMAQWNDNSKYGFQNLNILCIACGSNTIWLEDNLLKNKTGLHQRISFDFNMQPFNLIETKDYLEKVLNMKTNSETIMNYYLVTGGVAQYLNLIHPEKSFQDNINQLFYSKSKILFNEFAELFESLFNENDFKYYKAIIESFSNKKSLSFNEIYFSIFQDKEIDLSKQNKLYKWLNNLLGSGFISKQNKDNSKNNGEYLLVDLYCHFWLKYIKKHQHFIISDNDFAKWKGYAFEIFVLNNIKWIKDELKIYGETKEWFWQNKNAQIDLLMERIDCDSIIEAKYHNKVFIISNDYLENLNTKYSEYLSSKKQERKKFNKQINFIFVSMYGVKNTNNISFYYNQLIIDDIIS